MERELKKITKDLGQSTTTTYTNSYKKLRTILELKDKRKPVSKIPVKDVVDAINKVTNPSSRHSVFVIATKLFNYDKNKELFDGVKNQINKEKRDVQVDKNKTLNESLPSYKDINDAIKKEENPKKYITSFIMFRINTRNADIAYIDLHSKKKDSYDDKRNHIILDGKKAIYIRNIYKTSKRYGQKINEIKVPKFIEKVKEILGDAETKPLFIRKNGEHITPGSIASYLKKHIILGLNEGQIIKIVLKHADDVGNYNLLRKISANRGTTVQVLLNEYDISNIQNPTTEIIRQDQDVVQTVDV